MQESLLWYLQIDSLCLNARGKRKGRKKKPRCRQDGYLNTGGERGFTFADRASAEGGGLVEDVAQEAEQEVTADASE